MPWETALASGVPHLAPSQAPVSDTLAWEPALNQYAHPALTSPRPLSNSAPVPWREVPRIAATPAPQGCTCVSGALAPARFTHPSPARRSRARARGRAPAPPELHARLAGPPPRPSALPPSRSPSRQPVTPLRSSTPLAVTTRPAPASLRLVRFPRGAGPRPQGPGPGVAGRGGREVRAGSRGPAGGGAPGRGGEGLQEAILGATGDRPPPRRGEPPARASSGLSPPASSFLRRHLCPHPFLPFTYLRMNRLALPSLLQKTSVSPAPRRQSLLHLGFSPNLSQNPNVGFSGLYKSFSSRVPCSP